MHTIFQMYIILKTTEYERKLKDTVAYLQVFYYR